MGRVIARTREEAGEGGELRLVQSKKDIESGGEGDGPRYEAVRI